MRRGVETRVAKLEALAGSDRALLIWRRPNDDPSQAVKAARPLFAKGDRVMCAVWYGDDPVPVPVWHRDFPSDLSERALSYLWRHLREICEGMLTSGPPSVDPDWSTPDLWYEVLKVKT